MVAFFYFILYKYYKQQKDFHLEEYNYIKEFDGRQLSIFKKNFNILRNDKAFLNKFSLAIYKFADLAYELKYQSRKKYMNWDIINFQKISEDNYFLHSQRR